MFNKIKAMIQGSKLAQLIMTFIVGISVGAICYPTKHIVTKLTKTHQEEIATLNQTHDKEMQEEHQNYIEVASQYHSYKDETDKKINSLTTQVTTLKSNNKTAYYKIIHPDGTVEIRKSTETEVDESSKVVTQIQEEFKQKISDIEAKWSEIHKTRVEELQKDFDSKEQSYKKTIDTLQQSKVVDTNKKSFGLEAGALLNDNYYGHATYDVVGPFFLGVQTQFGSSSTAGLGIGLHL